MTLEEFLATKPTREEAIECLCCVANQNVLKIDDTFAWKELSEYTGVTADDFWDDREETIKRFGEVAITHFGLYNWKLKENN